MTDLQEYVVKNLKARKGQWPEVEKGSGVSARTFSKIVWGNTKNPRFQTLQKLAHYFQQQERVA